MCVGILKLTVPKSKADYNGEEAAIKVLECGKYGATIEASFKNEQIILNKLKDEGKSAEELGHIQLFDYIEEGQLVEHTNKEEKAPDQSHHGRPDDRKIDSKDSKLEPIASIIM